MSRALIAGACAIAGCTASPRTQAVVHVDTDLPIPLFADTLRIDQFAPDGRVMETRIDVAPDSADWPRSFGVRSREPGTTARFRIRAYPAARVLGSVPGGAFDAASEDDPIPEFAIDRAFDLDLPHDGVEHWLVFLPGDCLGGAACTPPAPRRIDEHPASAVGTWSLARPVPCAGEPRAARPGFHEEETCIEGGVFFLGDALKQIEDCGPYCSYAPERLVEVSPFYMDVHEVSVARWRDALARGFAPEGRWYTYIQSDNCHHRPDGNDALPMNCVSRQAAEELCAFDGGRLLPSEAQWEYAASGRGEERTWPWGEVPARCEQVVFGRSDDPSFVDVAPRGSDFECTVGRAFAADPVDAVVLDVSRDGVRNLGGNVGEWTRDEIAPYDAPCWTEGPRRDPVCSAGAAPGVYAARGTSWYGNALGLAVFARFAVDPVAIFDPESFGAPGLGFRCVRPAAP